MRGHLKHLLHRIIQRYFKVTLNMMPKHWKHSSLLYALRGRIIDGPHETPVVLDEGIPFISVDSINDSTDIDFTIVRKFISQQDYERYCKKTNIETNDIIFTKAATIGKTAIVKDDRTFMIWSPLAILKSSNDKSKF